MSKTDYGNNEAPFLNLVYIRIIFIFSMTMLLYIATQQRKNAFLIFMDNFKSK